MNIRERGIMQRKMIFCIFFLILFSLLSKYEDRPGMRNLDFAVTVKVQEKIDRSAHLRVASLVGNVMEGATYFAAPVFTSVLVLVLTAIAFKTLRWRASYIPIAFILIVLIELFTKSMVHHPSPPFSMIKHPTTIFPANYVNEQFSYPSGHAARAVYLALVSYFVFRISYLGKYKKILVWIGLVGYVFFVGLSRIYLGEHWFSDVVGGLLLGVGLALGSSVFLSIKQK